jgi:hypothetical protein
LFKPWQDDLTNFDKASQESVDNAIAGVEDYLGAMKILKEQNPELDITEFLSYAGTALEELGESGLTTTEQLQPLVDLLSKLGQ